MLQSPRVAWRVLWTAGLVLYAALLYQKMLQPTSKWTSGHAPYNLVPFRTIVGYLNPAAVTSIQDRAYQVLGNFLVLVPLALLLAVAWNPPVRTRWAFLTFLITSGGIEIAQYVMNAGRSADIDDVILNVSGATLVYVAFYWLSVRWRGRRASADACEPVGRTAP